MADPESVKKVLSKLSARGIRLAVDDFGTGYSSLAYLKHLPVTELKIDRSFIGSISTDGSDMAIVRSIVDLGRNLDLKVVAEGVETKDGMDKLRSLGCELAQGFYIGRPMPGNEVEGWVERWKSRTERLAA
jgi:EAL domain-containing protein (putative c-di-GMP-specific phosphodiesterase class I)